jgi:hypothetical protein
MGTVRRKQGRAKIDVLAVAAKFCAGSTSLNAEAFSVLLRRKGAEGGLPRTRFDVSRFSIQIGLSSSKMRLGNISAMRKSPIVG